MTIFMEMVELWKTLLCIKLGLMQYLRRLQTLLQSKFLINKTRNVGYQPAIAGLSPHILDTTG